MAYDPLNPAGAGILIKGNVPVYQGGLQGKVLLVGGNQGANLAQAINPAQGQLQFAPAQPNVNDNGGAVDLAGQSPDFNDNSDVGEG